MKRNLLLVLALGVGSLANAQCDITGPDPIMCLTGAPVSMSVASPGAVYSGPGVSGNVFSPSAAGIGSHTISVEAPGVGYSVNPSLPYAITPIAGTTVSLGDDAMSADLPIGFNFNYFGATYTTFRFSSNGFLAFNGETDNGCCSGSAIPYVYAYDPKAIVAICWDDLNPGSGGTISYQTVGTAPNRILVADWNGVRHYGSTNVITGQIKLYETTNCVEVHITTQNDASGSHTLGIQNQTQTIGYAAPGKNSSSWTASNFAISFCPNVGCSGTFDVDVVASPTVNGTVDDNEICLGESIILTSSGTATSYSWGVAIDEGVAYTPTEPGLNNYIVAGTDDATGCIGTDMVSVFVHDIPYVNAGSDKVVCSDNLFTLSAAGDEATYVWDNGAVNGVPMMQAVGSVTYTVTATNAGGCEATSSVTVESLEVPTGTGIVSMMTGFGYDGSINFTPSGGTGGPYTYLWSNGATTQDVSALTVGSYTVTVSDGTCNSDVTFFVDSQAGIEFEKLDNLSVYPNPVVDVFTIDFDGTYSWVIYDNVGQIVALGQGTGKEVISMEQLAAGSYMLKVAVDGKESVVSLVKN